MEKLRVKTGSRNEMVDITDKVSLMVKKMGIMDGILHLFVPHTTCGLAVNENAYPSVKADISGKLCGLVPEAGGYNHFEGNSDSHIKAALTGSCLSLFVEEGVLLLGRWQGIFLCEFDGPREREVWLKSVRQGDKPF